MIWVHDELFKFFKALKDLGQRPKGEKQQAGKKADEAKAMFEKALQMAPAFHRGRRIYLAGLLEQQVSLPCSNPETWTLTQPNLSFSFQISLFKNSPGLMGPKMLHLQQLLSLCRYEAVWVVRHQSNLPEKKRAQAILGSNVVEFFKDSPLLWMYFRRARTCLGD